MRRTASLAAWALALLTLGATSNSAWADVIHLKNGSKIEGEVLRKTPSGWVVKAVDGKVVSIAATDVKAWRPSAGGIPTSRCWR